MSETDKTTADDGANWDSAMAEQADAGAAKPAPMETLQDQSSGATSGATIGGSNMEMILEIPVTVSMEIGRTRMNIRTLLQLNQGSVVELDRLAGEPMDVLVNGTLIAHGEVVVVNEKFGIRLTDVISPSDRLKKLK